MAEVSLDLSERTVLMALMTLVEEATNADIRERYGFVIERRVREALENSELISVRQLRSGAYVHELTETGWLWCRAELNAEAPPKAAKGYRLFYGLAQALDVFLTKSQREIADFFLPATPPETPPPPGVDDQIRAVYATLASRPGGWVSLTRLRDALSEIPRDELDEALLRLDLEPRIDLIPEANQKTLSSADREAAIRIGGEDKHLLSIDHA
jgi:hypothetical protein